MKNYEKKNYTLQNWKLRILYQLFPTFHFLINTSPTREKSRVTFCDSEATWSHNEFSVIYNKELRQPKGLQPQFA